MERVAIPRKGEATQPRTEQRTEQHAKDGGDHTPRSHHEDSVVEALGVARVIGLGDIAHTTHGNTEIGTVAYKLRRRVEERHQAHTLRPEDEGHELIAHDAYEDIQRLNTPKKPRVFEYITVI